MLAQQANDFFDGPDLIRDPSFHCRRHAERWNTRGLSNPATVG
jgi:hypothetical protein